MHHPRILQTSLGVALLAALAPASHASLLLYYNFDSDTLLTNGIVNRAPNATTNGTLTQGTNTNSLTNFVASGAGVGQANAAPGLALSFTEPAGGGNKFGVDYIETNFVVSALSLTPSTNYTAMAWVKFGPDLENGGNDDAMIFGSANSSGNEDALHLGARGTQIWSGQWGDDVGGGTRDRSNWHHVAYTNDTTGLQQIYVDGLLANSGGGGAFGSMRTDLDLLIGTSTPGGSAFNGIMDEVKVFNTVLTPTEINAAKAVPISVPEPSAFAAMMGGAAVLSMIRRRRA